MTTYQEKLMAGIEKQKSAFWQAETGSVLESLYIVYAQCNPMAAEASAGMFEAIKEHLQQLNAADQDSVFDIICAIYTLQEKYAFLEGVRVGAHLAAELKF